MAASRFEGASTDDVLFDAFDLLADAERRARLAAQWRDGREDPERVIVLVRTIREDILGLPLETLMATLPGGIARPRAMFRAWADAQLACDAIRVARSLGFLSLIHI